ncbi:hypothetical protein SAMN05444278_10854 [Psychroflexus salarius]|uniref:Sulfotransferase family protein n=1 Tax=Psychroflexus salarius TaxID=1155689 RepID=A0A1M4XBB8_9FLAO|nr:hypothetical protein [Psychroflexus salarius]SHE90700.1 hypothetical protein SAMN05444278_10854 [Psychroflexus salarius]
MAHIFILCTGRSGSVSFIKACKHITNFTCGHETKSRLLGKERFEFPDQHIEADNRLIWDLGRLEKYYGNKAKYIYLKRDSAKVAKSFTKRTYYPNSIFKAYCDGIKKTPTEKLNAKQIEQISTDFVDNMTTTIENFINKQKHTLVIDIDHIENDFKTFWDFIEAKGDLQNALDSFKHNHNASALKSKTYIKYHIKLFFLRFFKSIV